MYVREAHPIDSNWGDPSVPVVDPLDAAGRQGVARQCAAALNLSIPMAVDTMDDAVSLAYNAWPERLYVVKADGTIAYKSDLGPWGFKPNDCAAALAALLGEDPPDLHDSDSEAPPSDCEDDGFSGTWKGEGSGPASQGNAMTITFQLALGAEGRVGGKFQVQGMPMGLPLVDGTYDAETGSLSAGVPMRGQRWKLAGTISEKTFTGKFSDPRGRTMFEITVTRTAIGYPLVPGVADATGTWTGTTTARDPALADQPVSLTLDSATANGVTGTLRVAGRTATIRRGRYDAATGGFQCMARDADGGRWQITGTVRDRTLQASAMLPGVALAVGFTVKLPAAAPDPPPTLPAPGGREEDF